MRILIDPTFVIVLFVCVRSADLAITYGISRSVVRAVAYGIVALLALIAAVVLIGVK